MEDKYNIRDRLPALIAGVSTGFLIALLGIVVGVLQFRTMQQDDVVETTEVLILIQKNLEHSFRELNSIALLLAQTIDEFGNVVNFEEVSESLIDKYPTINMMEVIVDNVVTKVYPTALYEGIIGYNFESNQVILKELTNAFDKGSLYLSGPFMLVEQKLGVVGMLPVSNTGGKITATAVIVYLDTILEEAQIYNFDERYDFVLSRYSNSLEGPEYFISEPEVEALDEYVSIFIEEGYWTLYAKKRDQSTILHVLFLVFCVTIVASVLSGYSVYKLVRKPEELQELLHEKSEELLASRMDYKLSSELLDSMLQSPQGMMIYSIDNEYNYLSFNNNQAMFAKEHFGVKIKPGDSVFESVAPDKLDLIQGHLNQAFQGKSFEFVHETCCRNGYTQYWQNWYSPIRNRKNEINGVTIFSIDITDKIEAEKEIEQKEYRFRTLITSSPYCIHELDKNAQFISMNEAGLNMLDLKSEKQILGKVYYDLMPNDRSRISELFEKALEGEECAFEFQIGDKHFVSNFIPIKNEESEIDRIMGITLDVSEQKESDKIIADSLFEKTILLSEIHHRVKNNLAIVSGLLQLQKSEVNNEELSTIFDQSINRIISIAMVHELMYKTEDLSSINVNAYIEKLIPAISATMQNTNDHVRIELNIVDYKININQAIPLGLLFNELITNSFKYAFNGSAENHIAIDVTSNDDEIKVQYSDNGKGFPDDIDFNAPTNLGLKLIHAQLQQLDAKYSADTQNKFTLDFTFLAQRQGSHSGIKA